MFEGLLEQGPVLGEEQHSFPMATPGMVPHAGDPSSQAEAEGSSQVQGYPELAVNSRPAWNYTETVSTHIHRGSLNFILMSKRAPLDFGPGPCSHLNEGKSVYILTLLLPFFSIIAI